MECKNSALCIFDKQPIQTDIEHSYVEPYYPISGANSRGSDPLEFHIEGNTEDYIDCHDIYTYVKYKIVIAAGTDIVSGIDKVDVTNLPRAIIFGSSVLQKPGVRKSIY